MATVTTTEDHRGELRLPLDEIHVRENVRDLDPAHVDALAQSIALRGVLVPLIVRQVDRGHELVAGFHRLAACRQLGLTDAPVVVREHEGSSADSSAENLVRKQLSPLESARAVQSMLDEGYTLDGAAQALGWSRQLVSARAKILKLPEVAQELVGAGEIPVSAVDNVLTIAAASPALAQAVAEAVAAGDVRGSELVNNPGWAVGRGAQHLPKGSFAAYLNTLDAEDRKALRLGKKLEALVVEAEKLHKQVEQYAYGPPVFRFTEQDTDQARAAGVLVEFPGDGGYGSTAPIITDHAVYRELAKQVIPRTVEELRARLAAKQERKTAAGKSGAAGKAERTPREDLDTEHRAALRDLTVRAHGVNLDLGSALLKDLWSVSPDSMEVARFFAFGLLGRDTASYLGTSDHVARTIAANGLRLVVEEHRTTTTPTLKSGKRGRTKVAYADVDQASAWLWKFVSAAKTSGELYGRTLIAFAAQNYAFQMVLPTSDRRGSALPGSYKDTARKAFEKIAKPVLPGTYVQLQKAIAAEARSYHKRVDELAHAADLDRKKNARAAAQAAETVEDAAEAVDPADELEEDPGEDYPIDPDDEDLAGEND